MATVKNLPITDQPREKALRYGTSSLSDVELLSLLLGKGYRDNNILLLSQALLSKYGGIVGLLNVPIVELKKNKGIKDVGALKIAIISEFYKRISQNINRENEEIIDDEYLYNKYNSVFYHSEQESLILVILNRKKKIIYETTLYKGSRDAIPIDFEDIHKMLSKYEGKSFYLIHNHPSGDCFPSEEDIDITVKIVRESKRIRVPIIDHLIIGDNCYYSFKKMKKISFSC